MPIRRGGESDEEARSRQQPVTPGVPAAPTDPLQFRQLQPPSLPPRKADTLKRRLAENKTQAEIDARPILGPDRPFEFVPWQPTPKPQLDLGGPLSIGEKQKAEFFSEPFDVEAETIREFLKFDQQQNAFAQTDDKYKLDLGLDGSSPQELMGMRMTEFTVLKNLEALLEQMAEFDPDGMDELINSRGNAQLSSNIDPKVSYLQGKNYDTADPRRSLSSALEDIAAAHPDDLAQYLSTDAGYVELAAIAVTKMQTPVEKEGIMSFLFRTGSGDEPFLGVNFAEPILEQLPEEGGKSLDILRGSLEVLGDPTFLLATALFPPGGLAAKSRLAIGLAVGGQIGDEAAEAVGLPGVVGVLPGALAGVGALEVGFSRAAAKNAVFKSRGRPVAGEPASTILEGMGEIAPDFATLRRQAGESFGPPGSKITQVKLSPGEVKQGRHTFVLEGVEGEELGRLQWRTSIQAADEDLSLHLVDVVAQTERQGVGTALMEQLLDEAATAGIKTITADLIGEGVIPLFKRFGGKFTDAQGNVLTAEKAAALRAEGKAVLGEIDVAALPSRIRPDVTLVGEEAGGTLIKEELVGARAIAGGRQGPDVAGFRQKILVHIERPEARDFLRLIAGKVADWVPLGAGKRLSDTINHMAVADAPTLKAAFGHHFQVAEDTAARFMSMATFKGTKVPFIENHLAQIWVPTEDAAARILARKTATGVKAVPGKAANILRKGDGEYIAVGDVFESILKGESKYLKRLNEEQVDFIRRIDAATQPYVSYAEAATGEQIAKREVHWPRYVLDDEKKVWRVGSGTGGKPTSLFQRQFESQQEAIEQLGQRYLPGIINQAESKISSMQRITRTAIMGKYLTEEGIITLGRFPRFQETYADTLGTGLKGVVSNTHANEILNIIGPASRNPVLTSINHINGISRLMLTGSLDMGWGALQLVTLAASPAGPGGWARAMTRGFYNALVEPKRFYRTMSEWPAAHRYARYGGDLGMSSEIMEAARQGGLGIPGKEHLPRSIQGSIDAVTYIPRSFLNRIQVGFDATLAYGRTLAFDAMADVAAMPGLAERLQGRVPGLKVARLEGQAIHDELFRVARFTDSLLGQPKLGGIIGARQHQIEGAFVWFATRYTRSLLATTSYMIGRGATPAMARTTMAKLMVGGMGIMSGIIGGIGLAQGHSQEQILKDIEVALNPASGKKFMSIKIGGDWYGLGGVYRSGFAAVAGLADQDNWDFESFPEALIGNPLVRSWRGRASPVTGQMINFGPSLAGLLTGSAEVSGSDFLGYPVNIGEFVDDPRKLGDYALKNFAPITLDALLGGHDKDWQTALPRFAAEFFGLRTSPETAWEALEPVLNKVSQDTFGVPYAELENNLVAQDYVRNHEKTVAVTDGQVRPSRLREKEAFWEKYRESRDNIKNPHIRERKRIEKVYTNGRMDGSQYREKYGESQAAEFFELRGLNQGLDVDFDSQDGEAPVGTVNYALEQYYNIDLDDYRDKDTNAPDWEAFFADRDAAINLVPPEMLPMVHTWLKRRETDVRKHMRTQFDTVILPTGYLRMRESAALSVGRSLDAMESQVVTALLKEDRRATPADVGKLIDAQLNVFIKAEFGEDSRTISEMRTRMRELDPNLDAELFRQGFVSTVRSEEAQNVLEFNAAKFPNRGYLNAPLAGDVKTALEKARQ